MIPPHDGRVAERLHGEVVNQLSQVLADHQIRRGKVRHIAGYEVDLVVGPDGPGALLVEVKTGALARDVQTGIGQLILYRHLIEEVRNHTPVLLLPAPPTPALAAAVMECGIAWHQYWWTGDCAGEGEIDFDEAFLSLCGAR